MIGYPGGHAGLVVAAVATHALVGYALGRLLVGRPWLGLLGGVAPDLDLLVEGWTPIVHRGVTHAPIAAALVVVLAAVATHRRDVAGAIGIGYASHVLLDATTSRGIPALFPLARDHVSIPGSAHAPAATLLLWLAGLGVLWYCRQRAGRSAESAEIADAQPTQMTLSGRILRRIRSV